MYDTKTKRKLLYLTKEAALHVWFRLELVRDSSLKASSASSGPLQVLVGVLDRLIRLFKDDLREGEEKKNYDLQACRHRSSGIWVRGALVRMALLCRWQVLDRLHSVPFLKRDTV